MLLCPMINFGERGANFVNNSTYLWIILDFFFMKRKQQSAMRRVRLQREQKKSVAYY